MRRVMTVFLALFMLSALFVAPASAAGHIKGELTVVHGIPDAVVDIYVDGALLPALDGVEFADVVELGELTATTYKVDVMADGENPAADTPILTGSIALPPGGNVTAVANLDAAGTPTLSVFNNDTTMTNVGQGRVTARHLAKAPAVDILAGGAVLFADVENGESGAADVPPGSYSVTINLEGTDTQVFGPAAVPVNTNSSTIAYAIGDATVADKFTVVAQVVPLSAPAGYANLSVVHGVPGLTVDVYINGNLAIEDFAPETITPRMTMAAGTYDIAIYAANANPLAEAPAIVAHDVEVPVGASASVVAYLDGDGNPTAGVFIDDFSKSDAGDARVTVRHTADAPAVDVVAGGNVLFGDLENGEGDMADVPAGTYEITLDSPPGSGTQVFPASDSVSLPLAEGANTFVYAIGTFGDPSFKLILSVVDGIGGFDDTIGSVHEDNIIRMSVLGITRVEDSYRPEDNVTRGEMAAFLRRALSLPASTRDFFTDDDNSIFENDINSIAEYGITVGSGGKYFPTENVTRGQMAAFIKRAFVLGAGGPTPFTDIDTSIFKGDIEAIYAAEITVGTSPTTYSPNDPVTRGQMATFLARALGLE